MSISRTIVLGTLGKNAEVKNFNNKSYLAFSVSVSNGKDAQGNYRDSTWFECLYGFNPQTQGWLTERLVKGSTVYIEGRVSARAYINKSNQAEASLNMMVNVLEPIGMVQKVQVQQQAQPLLQSPYGINQPPYQPQPYQPQVQQQQMMQGQAQMAQGQSQGYAMVGGQMQGAMFNQQQMQGGSIPQDQDTDAQGNPIPF